MFPMNITGRNEWIQRINIGRIPFSLHFINFIVYDWQQRTFLKPNSIPSEKVPSTRECSEMNEQLVSEIVAEKLVDFENQ